MREGVLSRLRGEEGMTLSELIVTMSILGIFLPLVLSVLLSVQGAFERQANRSVTNDEVRLAAQQLDKEIRSGNLLYDPASETPANMALRIYTQTNATTRSPGNRCVQWRIVSGELRRRDWSPTWRSDGIVSGWRTVADKLVNETLSPPVPAFRLDPDPQKYPRTLIVTLVVNQKASSGRDVRIQQSVTGRNTQFGYPLNVCSDVPPA